MRNIDPVKYSSAERFVKHKIELGDEDLGEILRADLERHADFDFDEVAVVNNRPVNIWLYAKKTPDYHGFRGRRRVSG